MFGHQDSTNHDSAAQPAMSQDDDDMNQSVSPQTAAPTAASSDDDDDSEYLMTDGGVPASATPLADMAPPASPTTEPATSPADAPAAPEVRTAAAPAAGGTNDLLDLKLAALHELTPLIDHLEQTAEEKFRTMMMMIQASDEQSLLSEAYQAAQAIEDKKVRAQALLDVVNEINYFTQQHHDGNSPS